MITLNIDLAMRDAYSFSTAADLSGIRRLSIRRDFAVAKKLKPVISDARNRKKYYR